MANIIFVDSYYDLMDYATEPASDIEDALDLAEEKLKSGNL